MEIGSLICRRRQPLCHCTFHTAAAFAEWKHQEALPLKSDCLPPTRFAAHRQTDKDGEGKKRMKDRRENIKRQMEGTGNLGEEEGLLGWQRRRRRLRWVAGERWRWRLPRPSLRHAWLKLRSCTCGVGGESGPGHVSNPLSEGFPNWFIKNNGQAFEEY